ncbi:MAG: HAMP domain-containing histidine kinase [Bacteroidales bacterium]|nr:HAMP domain-containing histidine kinase [Bacteroidales bacterium]MCF8343526.1 HAMP domain-containing histidine kinase [Bacteroidales bacterium]MCF8349817.1 HAMP domain-containing histidine kinase [Bacteroidales bacterium]MCF8375937.1 HAMP domain-containing histidine kinase [Bacteroidales bacterium]
MDIYTKKRRWKFALFTSAMVIVAASLWYTNFLVNEFARDERTDIRIWADAIQRKAKLVNYTDEFFEQIRQEEQKRAEVLAGAYKTIGDKNYTGDLTFFVDIIKGNKTIPVVLTDEKGNITNYVNYELPGDTLSVFTRELRREFSRYPPIEINYYEDKSNYLYYKESKIYTELRRVLNDLVQSFFSEVVTNSASVPVIVTDSSMSKVIAFGNIDSSLMQDPQLVAQTIHNMRDDNKPIQLELPGQGKAIIFYEDSFLLTQFQFFPFIQIGIIGLFFVIAYFLFSSARKAEQNRVWVGMSKETAHQIGTPLSSIMAWLELLKMKGIKDEAIDEMEKDIERLETITDRFSKIGSAAKMEKRDIVETISESVSYFKSRSSKKIKYILNYPKDKKIEAPINKHLFEWVVENLFKNAIDAMAGNGNITIDIMDEPSQVVIDFTDSGKGIPRSHQKSVFNPGYTSKKRGWGLGLTLSQRIIRDYHRGKIFVKNSIPGEGTTFRIVLKK